MKFLIPLVGLLLVALGSFSAHQFTATPSRSNHNDRPLSLATSYEIPQSSPLPAFELWDQSGTRFNNQALQGKWSLVYVGYTSCPDICPTMTAKLAAAYQQLSKEIDLQVIFISVDPARDTQAKLKEYMNFFEPEFIAVTAEHPQLLPITRQLGFVYAMVGEAPNYQVDHSASVMLISPEGKRVAVIKPKSNQLGQIPQIKNQALIQDVKLIVNKYS